MQKPRRLSRLLLTDALVRAAGMDAGNRAMRRSSQRLAATVKYCRCESSMSGRVWERPNFHA
jgi:hypothetical protein